MRMVINGLAALQGGGQTYLRNILCHLPEDEDFHIKLLLSKPLSLPYDTRIDVMMLPMLANPLVRAIWERSCLGSLLQQFRADLLFCPSGIIPRTNQCPSVVVFRNMLPFDQNVVHRYPIGWVRIRLRILNYVLLESMKVANGIIFLSHYAKDTIGRLLGVKMPKNVVIPHGVNERFRQQSGKVHSWMPNRYLAYVSILDVYKAQIEVVEAFAMLKRLNGYPGKLFLIGPEYAPYARRILETISSYGLEQDVIIRAVPYEELPSVYQHADVNIFASECENCPNILLEALAAGRPVVCSSRPPMPEFAGDAVTYFDPSRPEELAVALQTVLNGDHEAAGQAARRQSMLYDWRRSAEMTWKFLAEVAGKF